MIIKYPTGRHKRFRLLERIGGRYLTVSPPELQGVNDAYLNGRMTLDQAKARLEALRPLLEGNNKRGGALPGLSQNERLIQDFWDKSPRGAGRERKNPHSQATAKARYFEAARVFSRVQIESATIEEVRQVLLKLPFARRRKMISVLNTLWKHCGRSLTLPYPTKGQYEAVTYLTLEQAIEVAARLEHPLNNLVLAAFGTGCRPGEIYAATLEDLREGGTHLWVDKTWDQRTKGLSTTKNNKVGTTYVVAECREGLLNWLKVPVEERWKWWKKSSHAPLFQAASGGHDLYVLRHSYAHHMLQVKGAKIHQHLRQFMRDSVSTLEKYYLPWEQDSDTLRHNVKLFD